MTISGGTTWDENEALTLTASASTFLSTDVGDKVQFWINSGTGDDETTIRVRLTIEGYTGATIVTVRPDRTIPAAYRSTAFTNWEISRDTFTPLHHLEGEAVVALADGNVIEDLTVTDGSVTLPSHAAVVHIGLPYTSQLETLDINVNNGKATVLNIPTLHIGVQESRSIEVGTIAGFANMETLIYRDGSYGYDLPQLLSTATHEVDTPHEYSRAGRIAIQQTDPLPITITSITPELKGGRE
jgi:hypothetical protein